MTSIPITRALLSVSDKTGIVDLATALAAKGVELVSTGGTATALRAAGYHLIESLDEGDHSHFAFGAPGSRAPSKPRPQMVLAGEGGATQFRIIYAPTAR